MFFQWHGHQGNKNVWKPQQPPLRGVGGDAAVAAGWPAVRAGHEPRDQPLQTQPDVHLVPALRLQPGEASFHM